jgi:nitrile hydratase beta subunit
MNGVHDMGGMHGFGPVLKETDEPVFHEEWEGRVFGMVQLTGRLGKWDLDMTRHSNERIPPAKYLASPYYERWFMALEGRLIDHGVITREELATGVPAGKSDLPILKGPDVLAAYRRKPSGRRTAGAAARFRPGDRIVTHNTHPVGHTRLPRYARGKPGIIDRDHGIFVFADSNAMTRDEKPQHCYSVRFEARELWGPGAGERDGVYLDLWDDHLDPV